MSNIRQRKVEEDEDVLFPFRISLHFSLQKILTLDWKLGNGQILASKLFRTDLLV